MTIERSHISARLAPEILSANQPADRFYLGGPQIATFRNTVNEGDHIPEDWIGSTTTIRGEAVTGLTRLSTGQLLRDAVSEAPEAWLGARHLATYGTDTRLLVKLLDAGQRLPVHAHPDGEFAARHLGAAHGKAEAWHILSGGTVYLGLNRDIDVAELARLVSEQVPGALLEAMHSFEVEPGDTVFVPPRLLHAIGEGIFLAEVQEPEDLSILLEWSDFDLDGNADGHLGLGFEVALSAVESLARERSDVEALIGRAGAELHPTAAPYFRLDRIPAPATIEAGFGVLIALRGQLTLMSESTGRFAIAQGATVLLPFDAGRIEVGGHGEVLLCRPPL